MEIKGQSIAVVICTSISTTSYRCNMYLTLHGRSPIQLSSLSLIFQ